ncbi:hypothetical protein ACIRD3_11185 [Kitasatospora sp. NPDC093550]|uniref:hypothetical protein n=1 Tax=Kitasatospora sp. NPDC093550 TaxID=3364089 RepID=UPI00382A719A
MGGGDLQPQDALGAQDALRVGAGEVVQPGVVAACSAATTSSNSTTNAPYRAASSAAARLLPTPEAPPISRTSHGLSSVCIPSP